MDTLFLTPQRIRELNAGFQSAFGHLPQRYFSAPGRTEISGNHTDHQWGCVLAAAVNLDTVAAVAKNRENTIQVLSQGYPLCRIDLGALQPVAEEAGTTAALIRGVAARFQALGYAIGGFDAYVTSQVLPGSGLSSSAAFEVLTGGILSCLFNGGSVSAPQIAMIGQYAENVFFGKPCGLMDQTASAVGGMVTIDFAEKENPVIREVNFDFSRCGYALCIIDSQASHADLTEAYAAIPEEMQRICRHFGCDVLRQVPEDAFYSQIAVLRQTCGDRAVMRAIHFFEENARVSQQVQALETGDFDAFLAMQTQSGFSSWTQLQNVIPSGNIQQQEMAVTLGLCRHLLAGRGAYRVHGGGFAGTVQAFVPLDMLDTFRAEIDKVLGLGACHVLSIRKQGFTEAFPQK